MLIKYLYTYINENYLVEAMKAEIQNKYENRYERRQSDRVTLPFAFFLH